jgi:protein gp37
MNRTAIEWTDFSWNPIRARLKVCFVCSHHHQLMTGICGYPDCKCTQHQVGTFCTHASPGCKFCYAAIINKRFGNGLDFIAQNLEKVEFFIDEKILAEPLKRKKPARIFVGDMFDLFHEAIPDSLIARVFYAMQDYKTKHRHIFQILTKRAERMRSLLCQASWWIGTPRENRNHIHLGVSVEDQPRADERIPILRSIPGAVRFLSVEPQLEAINLKQLCDCGVDRKNDQFAPPEMHARMCPYRDRVHWVICGGESGPEARPFRTLWAEHLLHQCREAGIPFFMKQLGSHVIQGGERRKKKDRKGGDMDEWPHELRVREFPA